MALLHPSIVAANSNATISSSASTLLYLERARVATGGKRDTTPVKKIPIPADLEPRTVSKLIESSSLS